MMNRMEIYLLRESIDLINPQKDQLGLFYEFMPHASISIVPYRS